MKILIAEDNPMWAKLLEENTRQWKFDPIIAPDGDAALECLQSESSICLAILDWQMPGVSGIEVCQHIKNDTSRPFTYVVMLTSRDAKEDIVAGLDAGADDYLTKPVEMAVLKSRLGAARRIVEAIPPKDWTKPQIDGYDVKKVLGKGAFATVWEALRLEDGEEVAIKILRVDLATEKVFGRFAREVKMLETLDHEYITRVYDSRVDQQVGYYVMDLIRGGTLYDYEKRSPSGVERIRMIQRVCEGLEHAHQRGVIHRDMKFSN
ncbi:MAG: response regulator, partial [Planctomycetota bacterium]